MTGQVGPQGRIVSTPDNAILVAVNLDPRNAQGCHFEIPLWRFGLGDDASIAVEDLLTGHRFAWTGKTQHVGLHPPQHPYAVWVLVPPAPFLPRTAPAPPSASSCPPR